MERRGGLCCWQSGARRLWTGSSRPRETKPARSNFRWSASRTVRSAAAIMARFTSTTSSEESAMPSCPPPYATRKNTNVEGKVAIARLLAGMLQNGDTLIVDESSTALFAQICQLKSHINTSIFCGYVVSCG